MHSHNINETPNTKLNRSNSDGASYHDQEEILRGEKLPVLCHRFNPIVNPTQCVSCVSVYKINMPSTPAVQPGETSGF